MNVVDTSLKGVKIIEPQVFEDKRGFFQEIFNAKRYNKLLDTDIKFVQDNHSRSYRGVLRGLHFQKKKPQGKLVFVTHGTVYAVVADITPHSTTYAKYVGIELSDKNHRQIWIPPGYAHGFCVITDMADFVYKCTDYYDSTDETGIAWNCPLLNITWPLKDVILSEKDLQLEGLKSLH